MKVTSIPSAPTDDKFVAFTSEGQTIRRVALDFDRISPAISGSSDKVIAFLNGTIMICRNLCDYIWPM